MDIWRTYFRKGCFYLKEPRGQELASLVMGSLAAHKPMPVPSVRMLSPSCWKSRWEGEDPLLTSGHLDKFSHSCPLLAASHWLATSHPHSVILLPLALFCLLLSAFLISLPMPQGPAKASGTNSLKIMSLSATGPGGCGDAKVREPPWQDGDNTGQGTV